MDFYDRNGNPLGKAVLALMALLFVAAAVLIPMGLLSYARGVIR